MVPVSEGKRHFRFLTDLGCTVLIGLQCWYLLNTVTDGQLNNIVKGWWDKIHQQAKTEAEIERQFSYVLFEAYDSLREGN